MYKRLIILSVIIFGALLGMVALGFFAVEKWAEGIEGKRIGEFAEVAEQVRGDVKRKLDEFIRAEDNRPYTHYQFYYVPDDAFSDAQQQVSLVRSPLAGIMENDFAYGYFQIDPEGNITTPNDELMEMQQEQKTATSDELFARNVYNIDNIKRNVIPVLRRERLINGKVLVEQGKYTPAKESIALNFAKALEPSTEAIPKKTFTQTEPQRQQQITYQRSKALPIESLQKPSRKTQVLSQRRAVAAENITLNEAMRAQRQIEEVRSFDSDHYVQKQMAEQRVNQIELAREKEQQRTVGLLSESETRGKKSKAEQRDKAADLRVQEAELETQPKDDKKNQPIQIKAGDNYSDSVQIRVEPFVPVVVGGGDNESSIFGGQVFYLRHIQIEDKHLLQGFQFNEKKLIEEIKKSATSFKREKMDFELSRQVDRKAVYTAVLDFGFGEIALNLRELIPGWIEKDIKNLYNWYFGTIVVVFVAVSLGLASLWRNAKAQLRLAEKKDDFISAVSHELRTPLTSIRMYSEMLERDWIKTEDKKSEYYRNMRQETERLSRLVENVLDFSRIQRRKKKYSFALGDINECINSVVEMMNPYAAQRGFTISTQLERIENSIFDKDSVSQIVINLLDNAIKYARDAEDKIIIVQSRKVNGYIFIEVEDHGPGIPRRERKRIFEQFYRVGSESTRETAGTGLGLALVKKFAEAHNGFVEIIAAKPKGAIFRVGLSIKI